MSLKKQWVLNIAMVLFSWLSLSFFGWRNLKRFLPASILVIFLEAWNAQIGKRKKWWIFYNKPKSYISGELPFHIGPFFVTSMWMLKWFYGNIKRFLLLNAAVDAFFAFIVIKITEKLKVVKLVRLNPFQFFLYFFYKAVVLYGLQFVMENKKKSAGLEK